LRKQDIHIDVISSDIEMPGTMNDFGFAQSSPRQEALRAFLI
jgi:hypothetical protein